jgi:predicted nucleic acid-binding protein
MVTTNLVIAESYASIRRSMGHSVAIRFLQSVHESRRLRRIASSTSQEERAEATLIKHGDQDFSFTDAVSFAVMLELGVGDAFAFDRHFLTAGFTLVPAVA